MVMLASYESILVRIAQVLYFDCGNGHFTYDAESLSCDECMLLHTSGFSTGFANGHYKYTSAVSSASVSLQWLFELVCDDAGN